MSATKVTGSPARNLSRTVCRNSLRSWSGKMLPPISITVGSAFRSWNRLPWRPGTASSANLRASAVRIKSKCAGFPTRPIPALRPRDIHPVAIQRLEQIVGDFERRRAPMIGTTAPPRRQRRRGSPGRRRWRAGPPEDAAQSRRSSRPASCNGRRRPLGSPHHRYARPCRQHPQPRRDRRPRPEISDTGAGCIMLPPIGQAPAGAPCDRVCGESCAMLPARSPEPGAPAVDPIGGARSSFPAGAMIREEGRQRGTGAPVRKAAAHLGPPLRQRRGGYHGRPGLARRHTIIIGWQSARVVRRMERRDGLRCSRPRASIGE